MHTKITHGFGREGSRQRIAQDCMDRELARVICQCMDLIQEPGRQATRAERMSGTSADPRLAHRHILSRSHYVPLAEICEIPRVGLPNPFGEDLPSSIDSFYGKVVPVDPREEPVEEDCVRTVNSGCT
jgi:hypothetical protein